MTTKSKADFFPGFVYSAQSISAYRLYLDIFIISLKDGHTVRFDPKQRQNEFVDWLKNHQIRQA